MRWFPWISREMHESVVAAKDALIRSLEAQNAVLAERLAEPVKVAVELPKDFAVIQQAVVAAPAKRKKKPDAIASRVDYAEIDDTDPVQLATIVNYHLGPRAATANRYERRQVLQGIIAQIRAAKEQRLRDRALAAENRLPEQGVPKHILEMVSSAEGADS